MEVPIQQAIDEGITVVNFDIAIEADGVTAYPATTRVWAQDAAEYIIDKVGTEGTVVVLDVPTLRPPWPSCARRALPRPWRLRPPTWF
ncbi:MAG: hypothetical protein ACLRX2_12600 [Oscillospiraceae bacterium]